jgi:bifunctional DNA-binding transcriptional regulator/antitoxin component of YhaV-PrlF toxin-antitoxin module
VASVLVSMNGEGRLTIPAAARRELGLEGEAQFQAEVHDGVLILRPAVVIPREDAWAYTPEHRAALARARQDSQEGRVRRLSEDDLDRLAPSEA